MRISIVHKYITKIYIANIKLISIHINFSYRFNFNELSIINIYLFVKNTILIQQKQVNN